MKNLGYLVFWSMPYLGLLFIVWCTILWRTFAVVGDVESRTVVFEYLVVGLGWLSNLMLIGIAGGYHQKKS